jgi:hypothetical protein
VPLAQPAAATPDDSRFVESDNVGTLQDTLGKAESYWLARQFKERKEPYLLYWFASEAAARRALLGLPFVHGAHDTGSLICTKALSYGYYDAGDGRFEAILAGWELDLTLFTQAKEHFSACGGAPQGDGQLSPNAAPQESKKSKEHMTRPCGTIVSDDNGTVKFVKKYQQPNTLGTTCTYRIYRATDSQAAKQFLQKNPVPRPLHYIVVETPQGNWGRDKDGIYQE